MNSLDSLNAYYGRGTLTYASAGRRQAWKLRRDFISPRGHIGPLYAVDRTLAARLSTGAHDPYRSSRWPWSAVQMWTGVGSFGVPTKVKYLLKVVCHSR
ncbi:DUF4113 domain-containing protein [Bradyrhizobium sp. S3.12.5]|uniref:DUF4113 domain-containing protein n=1 Tax=Bradyrhizobium sp. S3.12.5 TaxID=3156386 RepID=UPI0033920DDF